MRKKKLLPAAAYLLTCGLVLSACSSGGTKELETVSVSAEALSAGATEMDASTDAAAGETAEATSSTDTSAAETAEKETGEVESTDASASSETGSNAEAGNEAETGNAAGAGNAAGTESPSETNTSAGTTGLSSGWDETLLNMLMPMDALMMTAVEQGQDYDPSSPEFFWGALYRELGLYADASSLITTEESGEIKVPRQTAQEFATGLFADYSDLPALPESLSSMIRYDEGWDAYFLSPGDRGLSAAELLTASLTEDGGYDMTARLYDVTDSSDICVYRFHLVPNAYADGITEPLFLYSVESMSLQE
ncbi:MAG TPA: hypothetical protein H9926_01125 [Candidatus Eisenbergiella intestinigallinarum]|uniref:SLH domain-containing protein n=1 Tax=Candidatus Eisenbergiella intestinigallinarum TaxID=2838549 RepID=A0A9D2QHD0_9FIRM|nr:hypothetical protein [Candidatus Eisenbergiella intestinigallinarum]